MADTKTSALTAITGANTATGDKYVILDVNDVTQGAGGTLKNITRAEQVAALKVEDARIGTFLAADETKLDGIETAATADQTAGEIEAIVDHDNLIGFVANEHIDWTAATDRLLTTIADTGNVVGAVVTQNDTTNNPNAMNIVNTGTGSTLFLNNDGNSNAILIDSESTTADVISIPGAAVTNGNILDINSSDALVGGRIARFHSDSSDVTSRRLVEIINDNTAAVGATVLSLQQDAVGQVAIFDQNADSSYVDFRGTAGASVVNPISTNTTSGATTHHIQIEINGTKAWIAVSTTNPS